MLGVICTTCVSVSKLTDQLLLLKSLQVVGATCAKFLHDCTLNRLLSTASGHHCISELLVNRSVEQLCLFGALSLQEPHMHRCVGQKRNHDIVGFGIACDFHTCLCMRCWAITAAYMLRRLCMYSGHNEGSL